MSAPSAAHPVSWSAVREQVYMVFPNDLNSNDAVHFIAPAPAT